MKMITCFRKALDRVLIYFVTQKLKSTGPIYKFVRYYTFFIDRAHCIGVGTGGAGGAGAPPKFTSE